MSTTEIGKCMRLTAATLWFPAVILIIILFVSLFKNRNKIRLKHQSPYRLSITICVFVITAGISFFYVHLLRGLGQQEPAVILTIVSMLAITCLMMEFTLIQFIFINRLSITFKNSLFDYPQWFYISMYVFVIMMVVSVFVGELSGFWIIKGFGLFVTVFNCIFLTVLFVYSLKKVIKSETERSLRSDSHVADQNDDQTDDANYLINIMIKYIVLLSLSMTSSAIFAFFIMAQDLESISHITIHGIVWILQAIDSSINIICVYFQFRVFEVTYFRYFGAYHRWIAVTFFNRTQKAAVDVEMLQQNIEQTPNDTR